MTTFTVNGRLVECADDGKKLLGFLRDDLRLTSAKDGCSAGACGTCTVLVDGKPTKACLPTVAKMDGKDILTVEGLSQREKDVYAYSFATTGAVQCGFCIPGMVISAKGLLDSNLSPTREDVKKAIKGNICRCTGYVKIEDAILLAADFLREDRAIPETDFTGRIGEDFHRVDAPEKTLGTGIYVDDIVVDGMVYAKGLRTRFPRARVLSIDSSEAEAHPECIRVITAEDIPGQNKIGHLIHDWDTLIAVGDITRYVGDAVALAVVNKKEALDEVLSLIKVEYEELTPLTSPAESLAEGAPKIHENGNLLSLQQIKRGDADAAIADSKHIVTRYYSVPFTEHAFMEPECAIAMPDGDDGLLMYTGGQSIYDEQREISLMLGIAPEKLHIKGMLVGGGFGGKEDMSVQHHAALAAWIVKKPVKILLSRQESIMIHPKRHAMEIDFTTACDEKGIITGVKAQIISDTGAYASLGGPVLQRACTHAGGPYNFQNIEVIGKAAYTNNPPAGAFRGFGVPQSAFAMESNLNLLAEMVGISPWEIRFRNAIRPGQELPNGQIADVSTALEECLLAVKEAFDKSPYTGIASSFKNSGLGVGVPDISRCIISVESGESSVSCIGGKECKDERVDRIESESTSNTTDTAIQASTSKCKDSKDYRIPKIYVRTSAACIGQGMHTILTQMVCETLNIPPSYVVAETPDTTRTPNAGTTTASRQTVFSGEAAVMAARQLSEELSPLLDSGKSIEDALEALIGREYYAEFKPHTDPMGSDLPNPVSHVAYGYAAQVAELDESGKLKKVTAAYDLGRVVNPKSAEGQIEGGIVMGVGYALTEDYPVEDGYPKAKYGTLGLVRATEAPEIETIILDRKERLEPAYGAKGCGELATIPTAPAIAGAYYRLDGKFRAKLPIDGTFYRK